MTWQILVDWEKDGTFGHAKADITSRVINRLNWFLGTRFGNAVADETTLNLIVDNEDRLFSKDYQDADVGRPLYGLIKANIPLKILYDSNPILVVFVNDILPEPLRYGSRTASIKCKGIKHFLSNAPAFPKLFESTTVDQIVEYIALAIGLPPAAPAAWVLGRTGYSELGQTTILGTLSDIALLESGQAQIEYAGDNIQVDEENAGKVDYYTFFKEALIAEGGRSLLFMNREGKYVFWNRYHFYNDDTPDVTLDNNFQSAEYTTAEQNIITEVRVTYYPRDIDSAEIVWQARSPLSVRAGETYSFFVHFGDKGRALGATNIQQPSGTDLFFTKGSAGVTVVPVGQGATITIDNVNGVDTAIIETLIIRADPLRSQNRITITAIDETLSSIYGTRIFNIDARLVTQQDHAQAIANFELVERGKELARMNRVKIKNTPEAFNYTIGDCVRIIDDQTNHDRNYHIIGENWMVDIANNTYEVEWEISPVLYRYWDLEQTGYSELGSTTRLAPI